MITTGIIREINISSGNYKNNKYKVELNIFQIPGDTDKNSYTFEANCMVASGFSSVYNVGDKVFVGFLNNDKSFPIILGKIYQGISDDYRGYGALTDLKVKNSVELPNDILIGEYDYDDIDTNFKKLSLLSIQQINQIITLLASTPLTHKHLEAINETAKQLTEQISRLNSIITDTNASLNEITKATDDALKQIEGLEKALDEEIEGAITLLQDEIQKEVNSATEDFNATIVDAKNELNDIIESAKTDLEKSIDEVEGQIATLDATIQELTGDTLTALWDGINRKIDLIECADNTITAEMTKVSKTINVTDDVTQETSTKTVISNNVKIAAKISNNADNDLFLDNSEDTPGLRVHKYQIKRSDGTADAAAVYQLMVNGKVAGDPINIPHDLVVESGTVETVKEIDTPYSGAKIGDFYIKLVIKNQSTPIYIPANSLVEYVTSGSKDGDDIIININEKHQVSAELGTTFKNNINAATNAAKYAHSHANADALNKINSTDIDKWNNQSHIHSNKDVLDKISDAKLQKWDTEYNQSISITLYVTANKSIKISGVLGWRWIDMCEWAFNSNICSLIDSGSGLTKTDIEFKMVNGFISLNERCIYYKDISGSSEIRVYIKPNDLLINGKEYYLSNPFKQIMIGKDDNVFYLPSVPDASKPSDNLYSDVTWDVLADHLNNQGILSRKCIYTDLPVFVNIPVDERYLYSVSDFDDVIDDMIATNIQEYTASKIIGNKFKLGVQLPCNSGHSIMNISGKAPTCTEEGWSDYTKCANCNYTTFKKLPARGHTFSEWIAEEPATCDEAGTRGHYYCSACNKNFDAEKNEIDTLVIPALGHDTVQHSAQAETCTEIGWNAYETCTRCDYTTYEEIPAAGHVYGDWIEAVDPTCESEGNIGHYHCSVCDKNFDAEMKEITTSVVKEMVAHEYDPDTKKCKYCGAYLDTLG